MTSPEDPKISMRCSPAFPLTIGRRQNFSRCWARKIASIMVCRIRRSSSGRMASTPAEGFLATEVETLIACAVDYHDCVYDSRSRDNKELSAEIWMRASAGSLLSADNRLLGC